MYYYYYYSSNNNNHNDNNSDNDNTHNDNDTSNDNHINNDDDYNLSNDNNNNNDNDQFMLIICFIFTAITLKSEAGRRRAPARMTSASAQYSEDNIISIILIVMHRVCPRRTGIKH